MITDIPGVIEQVRATYLADGRPWIVGYSGGKDSTAVAQIVYYMLKGLRPTQRHKDVHIVCNDTLVETPLIVEHMTKTLNAIAVAANRDRLPILTKKTVPPLKSRFFVKVIGRGYPAPTRVFRWCTDHMKIRPTNAYIKEQISKAGEVVIVLGTRRSESSQRSRTIRHYEELHGNGHLRPHGSLAGAYLYPAIQDLELEDVWTYLMEVKSPWGMKNRDLWVLYGKASGRDCPLVVDSTSQPCGSSRFGCWTCTVVRKDKSMEGLIDNGEEWLEPLLEYRDWLKEIREDRNLRECRRRDGTEAPGPFTLQAREIMFRRLMDVEREVGMELIPREEKQEIQRLWELDGYNGPLLSIIEQEQKSLVRIRVA
jgi:DNA sulfur modification protein DndC